MSSNSPYLLLVDSSNFQQLGHIDVGDGCWGQFILVTRLSPYFYMEKVMISKKTPLQASVQTSAKPIKSLFGISLHKLTYVC